MINALGLVIFELYMQTVLNPDFHLDAVVAIWGHTIRVYPYIAFLDDLAYPPGYRDADKVPQFDVDAIIRLVLLLDVLEFEFERLCAP